MFDFFCKSYRKRATITILTKSKQLKENSEIQFVFFHLTILAIRSFGEKCLKDMDIVWLINR